MTAPVVPDEQDPYVRRAEALVNKAISTKGVGTPGRTIYGPVRSFEDALCEQIFTNYVQYALEVVDDGRWQDAHNEARSRVIGQTATTFRNQG